MITDLILNNLNIILYIVFMILFVLIFKRNPSELLVQAIKGFSADIQKFIIEVLAEVAKDYKKANDKLSNPLPINLQNGLSENEIRKEVAIRLLKEKAIKTNKLDMIEKVADKVGGYPNLIDLVYKSARTLLKAIKK